MKRSPRTDRSKPLLLLIDDDRDTLVAGAHLLMSCGFDLEIARGGDDGVTKATQLQPDVIVSDVVMPNTSGVNVCEQLHANRHTRHIPIIIYTGVTDAGELARLVKLGVHVFAIKPCVPTVVANEARALVQGGPTHIRIVTGYGEQLQDFAGEVAHRALELRCAS